MKRGSGRGMPEGLEWEGWMFKPILQYLVNTVSWSCVNKIPQYKCLTQRTILMGLET